MQDNTLSLTNPSSQPLKKYKCASGHDYINKRSLRKSPLPENQGFGGKPQTTLAQTPTE